MIIPKKYTRGIGLTTYPIWLPSAIFLALLLVIPNSKVMGLALLVTLLFTLTRSRNLLEAIYYVLLLCLPFTKGKGFQFVLLGANQTGVGIPYTFDFDITFWNALLLILVYFVLRNRNTIQKLAIRLDDVLLVFFLMSLVPSILLSAYPDISTLGFIEVALLILLYFVTKLLKRYISFNVLSVIISLHLIFEGVWSIIQFILKHPLGAAIESSGGLLTQSNNIEYAIEQVGFFRSRGTFDQSNSLGIFAASLIPFVYVLLTSRKNSPVEKTIYALGVLFGIGAVIVSGSRTSIFLILIFFVVMFIIRKRAGGPFIHMGVIAKLIASGFVIVSLVTIVIPRMLQLISTLQPGGGLTFRTNLIQYAIQMMQHNIFGVGLGLFPKILFTDIGTFTSYPTPPHNLFAQIGAEGGIVALVVFCLFLWTSLFPVANKIIHNYHRSLPNAVGINQLALTVSLSMMILLSNIYPFLLRSVIFPYFWIFLALID